MDPGLAVFEWDRITFGINKSHEAYQVGHLLVFAESCCPEDLVNLSVSE